MKSIKKVRWGIIGCGDVTEVKSGPAYQNTEGFEIVAVMRRDAEKAADYAKRHGIAKYYSNADELIADDEVDAVYIATPPDSHREYALKVAASGKPCCVEKPMAPSYAESLEVYEAFKEKEIPLFVAYYRRSLPRFLGVKKWLDNNEIGKVRHVRWMLTKDPSDLDLSGEYNWRTDAKVAPGGYFDDLASHGLDLFIYYLGDIKQANGIALNQQGLYTAKDAITGTWLHEGGITGEATWNFGCDRREDLVEIYGSKGKISFSIFGEDDIVLENEDGVQKEFIEHPKHVQQFHVENLGKHLFEDIQHPSTGKTALHGSWVMDSILGNL
ncbi:Gfo/Idh/MocA family oxidoreductase [Aurantibacter crassamenti]|uniref:Gfo/Idh/MocA family protein n=1 Tax=Aurantibacter crassamenti TaxID=1837375 RepID=UPI00193A98E1|nr:Gfo/Idh/MocA family oxidoreductase [Aurantibacter crassamenti]MBM1104826.1 Gfo/Idh/MocA family oxidoreductase [Aurantibacter crassamenti]